MFLPPLQEMRSVLLFALAIACLLQLTHSASVSDAARILSPAERFKAARVERERGNLQNRAHQPGDASNGGSDPDIVIKPASDSSNLINKLDPTVWKAPVMDGTALPHHHADRPIAPASYTHVPRVITQSEIDALLNCELTSFAVAALLTV